MPASLRPFARLAGTALAVAVMAMAGCGGHAHDAAGLARAARASFGVPRAAAVDSGPYTLLTMPDDGMGPILQAIQGAQRSIKLKIYMLTDHDESAQLVQALVERAKAGLDVEVVLEVRPYLPPAPPDCKPVNVSPNMPAIEDLRAGGVRVRYASPRFKFTHEKSLVVDDATAFIMTCNFTNSAFTANREYVLVDHVAADVAELLRVFAADWDGVPFVPAPGPLVLSPENSRKRLLDLIDGAQHTLTVQVEYLTDPEVVAHLQARVAAGVDVKVMLAYLAPGGCPGDTDTNGQERQMLAAAGVTQVEFSQTVKMHAKCLVADGARAFLGSENLTANSLDNNREVGILLDDPVLVGKLAATALADWGLGVAPVPGGNP